MVRGSSGPLGAPQNRSFGGDVFSRSENSAHDPASDSSSEQDAVRQRVVSASRDSPDLRSGISA